MDNLGDFYAVVLHDDRLTAALVAAAGTTRSDQRTPVGVARTALAAGLRALAAVVDAPRPAHDAAAAPAPAR